MERDFMGLNSKEPLPHIKREIPDEGSEMQWSFMKKDSSAPHFMSFKPSAGQNDGTHKMMSGPISSGFSTTPTASVLDQNQKSLAGEIQPLQRASDLKVFGSKQAFSLSISNPAFMTNFGNSGQNLVDSTMRQRLLEAPVTIPSVRNNLKGFTGPAQMTIFYAGTVNVYDDISPEKAEAIMLLAGNGYSVAAKQSRHQVQSQVVEAAPRGADVATSDEPLRSQPNPNLSSSLCASPSQPTLKFGGGSVSKDEPVVTNAAVISSPVIKPEPSRASMGAVPVSGVAPSAVPQFRKASLARFLEKRKERVMNVAPYTCEKKPHEGSISSSTES